MKTKMSPNIRRAQIILDSLEHGSVVLDNYGHAWQLSRECWYRAYGDDTSVSSWELAQLAPLKTVHNAPKVSVLATGFVHG